MKSANVIEMAEFLQRRRSLEENEAIKRLEESWAIYEEFAEIAPYIPSMVLLKIKNLCEIVLEADGGIGS